MLLVPLKMLLNPSKMLLNPFFAELNPSKMLLNPENADWGRLSMANRWISSKSNLPGRRHEELMPSICPVWRVPPG